jgi:aminopeptidase N
MRDAQARTIYLKDYQVPAFLIERTELTFELGEEQTRVLSRLHLRRNPDFPAVADVLRLDGQDMELVALSLNDQPLTDKDYLLESESLSIPGIDRFGAEFVLSCETLIKPQDNTSLEGLYKSNTMFCTQCEAEGFRKITYYLDRPDVMARFCTTIIADKGPYPVLLSNGNNTGRGEYADGRHWVSWEDPFPKPCLSVRSGGRRSEILKINFRTMSQVARSRYAFLLNPKISTNVTTP